MKLPIFLTALIILSFSSFGQVSNNNSKSILTFEKCIINGNEPDLSITKIKYENDYRVILWDEPLIKNYAYSNEIFDKLGYELVNINEGDELQNSKSYRNCRKGIVVEVKEWYNMKLSISMEWFSPDIHRNIGYLAYCPERQPENLLNDDQGAVYKGSTFIVGEFDVKKIVNENVEIVANDSTVNIRIDGQTTIYNIHDKSIFEKVVKTYKIYTSKTYNKTNSFVLRVTKFKDFYNINLSKENGPTLWYLMHTECSGNCKF